jgi:hypothetical protein
LTALLSAILAGVPIDEYFVWLVVAAKKSASDGGAYLMRLAWAERRRVAAVGAT